MASRELTLRPLHDTDMDLLAAWLNKDYILKWYHNADEWLAEMNGRHDANDFEDWYHVTTHGDTFSIDYLIGNEAYLGKGYGKAIVKLLSDTIQTMERANRIIVQPEKENHASNHVLIANGFLYDEQLRYYCKSLNSLHKLDQRL